MSYNDHYPEDYIEHNVVCSICGKKFRFITEEQIPGFRQMDELRCPYCHTVVAKSMEHEFSGVEGLEEDGKTRKKDSNRSKSRRIRKN